MGLKVAGGVAMAVLIILNVIFVILGLGLLIMGIVFRTSSDVFFEDDVLDYLNEISLYGSVGLGTLVTNLSIYVIILGVAILLFGLLGGIAACTKNKCLLITYLILVIIMFINTVICLGFWIYMSDELENDIQTELYDSLENYDGVDSEDDKSKGLDKVQIKLKCCGSKKVDNDNQEEFKNSKWHKNKRKNANEKVPPSCCDDATEDNYKTLNNPNCQENLEGSNQQGCQEAIEEEAESYERVVFIILGVALVVEILAIIFAILLLIASD